MKEKITTTMNKPARISSFSLDGKLPPQAPDLEEAVLGAIMLERGAIDSIISIVKDTSFYSDQHREIYQAMTKLHEQKSPIDILTVGEQLRREGKLELVGGAYYITKLTNKVSSAANIEYHARIIQQKYILRSLINICAETLQTVYHDDKDPFEIASSLITEVQRVSDVSNGKQMVTFAQSIQSLFKLQDKTKAHLEQSKSGLVGIATGFPELDQLTGGWQKGDLILLAARPGMGKTSFALTLAVNAVMLDNAPVAIFSLETDHERLTAKILGMESGIGAGRIIRGDITGGEWDVFRETVDKMYEARIWIDDRSRIDLISLRSRIYRAIELGVGLIVIDYLQLLLSGSNKNREQAVAEISRELKVIAKEQKIPIIALSQLSREVEKRADKRPITGDLRESGSLEQDADVIMFIFRPEEYFKNSHDPIEINGKTYEPNGLAEIICAKNRNGSVGSVATKFVKTLTLFKPYEPDYEIPQKILPDYNPNIRIESGAGLDDDIPF